jgi:hypothetical protein
MKFTREMLKDQLHLLKPCDESRTDDKMHLEYLVEATKAICMEFKVGEHKGLREVAKRLNIYTKHT